MPIQRIEKDYDFIVVDGDNILKVIIGNGQSGSVTVVKPDDTSQSDDDGIECSIGTGADIKNKIAIVIIVVNDVNADKHTTSIPVTIASKDIDTLSDDFDEEDGTIKYVITINLK